jgi:uncharacterized protein with HEPN domain
MKARRDYKDYLRDVLDFTQKALRFAEGLDFQMFQDNEEKTL